jgi:signal transduction histidine kinase/DNA-binding response OmpR family regulator/CHASE3 domain sensor protein
VTASGIDSGVFRRILSRNIALPLLMSFALCGCFIALALNLISVTRQVSHSNLVIARSERTLKLVLGAETGLRGYLITRDGSYLTPYRNAIQEVYRQADDLKDLVSGNPAEIEQINRILVRFKNWNALAKRIVSLTKEGSSRISAESNLRRVEMQAVRAEFESLLKSEEDLRDQRSQRATAFTQRALAAIVLLSLLAGGLIAFTGRRQLLRLSQNYEEILRSQKEQNDLLTNQAWLRMGQTRLSERIRGELSAKELGSRLLAFVSEYVGATIGALYLPDESNRIRRIASFAFSPDAPQELERGEGLVGQALLEPKLVTLTDLPKGYLKVASGLGDSPPSSLVVAPLTADGVPVGAIELGFMSALGERVPRFLTEVAELAGVALRSAAYRTRLQDLLHESQQLTEELQTQQEELKVSNEELSERTRALQESQARIQSQHTELQQTNEQLEEQAQALEHQKQALDARNQELQDAQAELERKAEELELASRYKSEFLANMSHELRTPLNSSLILAKLLMDNGQANLTPQQIEFASTIYSSGNDLLNLINDILDLSKVEAGKLELRNERIPLENLIEGLEKVFRPLAREKKLRLELRIDPSAPRVIMSDRQRVEQILRNLVSNAIKFTHQGSIELKIAGDGDGMVSFAVIDTGIGIAPDHAETIFEAFKQADGTTARKYGGTGLGLSISRNLAGLLGGSIELKSVPGKGSSFTLHLPETPPISRERSETVRAKPPAQAKAEPVRAPSKFIEDDRDQLEPGSGCALLVVEDDSSFASFVVEVAREEGFLCLVSDNTADGFELAKRFLPKAAILDMRLPDALGLSLLDRLKGDPRTRHIPVQALSVVDYSREALHMGAAGYQIKPSDKEALRKLLSGLRRKIERRTRTVLVVEDDPTQRSSIELLIGEKGVEITSVGTGAAALAKLKEAAFDCMVIDLTLPDISGFDLLEKMAEDVGQDGSQDGVMALPPVIVYTGRSLSRSDEERLSRFSRSIIIKGARSPERLLDEVTLFLHQPEAQLSPERRRILNVSRNRERAFDGRRILLVDDDVRNIFALTSALEQKGAKVAVARNGREAVELVGRDPGIELVLMDIMMPEMDGYAAMKEIRGKPELKDLPIIAVTAKAMRDDYEKCLECGANDYLPKPVDVDRLMSLMRVWLPQPFERA